MRATAEKAASVEATSRDTPRPAPQPETRVAESDGSLTQALQEYVRLEDKRRELEAELAAVKEAQAPLHDRVLEWFVQAGIQRTTMHGMTCWVQRLVWAGAKDGNTPRLVEALQDVGLEDLVKEAVNTQTLSAYVREQERNGADMPAVLADAMQVTEQFKVRTRRG